MSDTPQSGKQTTTQPVVQPVESPEGVAPETAPANTATPVQMEPPEVATSVEGQQKPAPSEQAQQDKPTLDGKLGDESGGEKGKAANPPSPPPFPPSCCKLSCKTSCLSPGLWTERCWVRIKLWHTQTLTERHFKLIANEFDLIPEPPNGKESDKPDRQLWKKTYSLRQELACRIRQSFHVHLTEVLGFERMVLRLMPEDRLLSKAWSIRSIFRTLVPADTYRAYELSNPPDLTRKMVKGEGTASGNKTAEAESSPQQTPAQKKEYMDVVRADAEDLLNATHWWYVNSNHREQKIRSVKKKLFWALLSLGVCAVVLNKCTVSTPTVVTASTALMGMMGMMGAVLSIGRRMLPVSSQNITESDPVIKATQFDNGGTSLWLSVLVGGVSALVLYFLMVAGLSQLGPEILPQFIANCQDTTCCKPHDLGNYYHAMLPDSPKSFAKLLCFSFLAGFAEKFVPDVLDRMASKK